MALVVEKIGASKWKQATNGCDDYQVQHHGCGPIRNDKMVVNPSM